ncbi:MAG TPA: amidohydrolase family protein [Steroidobacteraceae bacterium]
MWNVAAAPSGDEELGLTPPHRAIDRQAPYRRIATEEAWNIPEILAAQVRLLESPNAPDDTSLRMAGMFSKLTGLQEQLMEIGPGRLSRMDELGIDQQLLLLTSPGVQVLEPAEGSALARLANDRLAEVCRRHPARFAGLTVFAPQDVPGAIREIERGMTVLGLNGAVINSHFRGHYLDELPYWPILEALEAHDAALYIHPTIPPTSWAQPYEYRGFGGALAGFSHEVWMHTMGLIMSGAFDRFPKLRLVIGHMGEAMPLLLYRFDWMQSNADGREGLRGGAPAVKLRHKISYYFKHNIWITTSGQGWEPSIRYCMQVLGPERVIYAMDYPYQQSADEVAAYDAFDLSLAHKKMLMQTNAESVFRLKT